MQFYWVNWILHRASCKPYLRSSSPSRRITYIILCIVLKLLCNKRNYKGEIFLSCAMLIVLAFFKNWLWAFLRQQICARLKLKLMNDVTLLAICTYLTTLQRYSLRIIGSWCLVLFLFQPWPALNFSFFITLFWVKSSTSSWTSSPENTFF